MAPQKITIAAGDTYGKWTVLAEGPRTAAGVRRALVQCACGTAPRLVILPSLRAGTSVSCGCAQRESARAARGKTKGKHAEAGFVVAVTELPEYHIWKSMKGRCLNPCDQAFQHYGGRGITLAPEWLDFSVFYADMGPRPAPDLSLDRIDNNGPYSKQNCRWADKVTQMRNRRSVTLIPYQGAMLPISEIERRQGLSRGTIRERLKMGWPMDKAISTPHWSKRKEAP